MGWFSKPRKSLEPSQPGDGPYHMVWERKRLPDPGANNYAWESLALPPFSPVGAGVRTREPIRPSNGQVYWNAIGQWIKGLPTVQGQMVLQPLYDPEQGYVAELPSPFSPAYTAALNVPSYIPAPARTNDPNPLDIKRGV